ncbi:MAG TPA: hypothetical protein VGP44_06490, partial [Gemmatimonadales bacterium]|nr:hypothetical protein [Gemmatimonadales bacterium]
MFSNSRDYQVGGLALLVAAGIAVGCGGENLVGPDAGTLEVVSATTGVELDSDGYTVQVDDGAARPLGPNATLRQAEITPGPHNVLLAGASANCSVNGDNPRSVNITAGETTGLTFAVACSATTGNLRIISKTTGPSPDIDGYTVTIDGTNEGTLLPTGETTIGDLAAGNHTVGIAGVSGNCQVDGDNPRSLRITSGSQAEAAFDIMCEALSPSTGTMQVTTATSGRGSDDDGYAFSVDGTGSQPIATNGTTTVTNLEAGVHSVELLGAAEHCTLSGANPRSVLVPGGGTVAVTFTLTCQATAGSVKITTTTSGPSGSNDLTFTIDDGSSQPIGANAALTVSGLTAGAHEVRLGTPGNCVVEGSNPRTISITAGNTAAIAFTIACSAGSVAITANPPVSALSGEVFDPVVQPAVQVKDERGNPVRGAEVTARISAGSGDLEGTATATTNASGVAQFVDLGIKGTGDHTLEFTDGSASVTSSPVSLSALPPEASSGKWGAVVPWDIVPLHMTLLPTGKIFAWGKTDVADTMGMPRIWDPSNTAPSGAAEIHVDDMLFCAGHTLMPDGRLMVSGGHHQDDAGIKTTYFFSPNGALQKGPDMSNGRWYPTVTVLADGRVITMAGRNQAGALVTTPEI